MVKRRKITNTLLAILLTVGGAASSLSTIVLADNEDNANISEINEDVEITKETEVKSPEIIDDITSLETEDRVGSIVKQNRVLGYRAIVNSGVIGTVNWFLDDTGVLTFEGGTFPDNFNWVQFGWSLKDSIVTVNFTAPITAGKSLQFMFFGYSKLTNITGIENLDTSNVINLYGMFTDCTSLTAIDLTNFNTSNVTNMHSMFDNCLSLTSLDLSNFNTSKVTDMAHMFIRCTGLKNVDLSSFDTRNVTDMSNIFTTCTSLTNVDLSNFDTSNLINMSFMFANCTSLTNVDLSNFDTSKVTDMRYMFSNCTSLPNVDLSKFDTSKVTDFSCMFWACSSLENLDITNFNTSSATDMSSMFFTCSSLTSLDVTNFDTSNVTDMGSMFSKSIGLTKLDISSFDTSSVTNMFSMFGSLEIKELTLGSNFRFKFSNHALGAPLNNEQYTGSWELVSNKEVFTQNELLTYDGTKQGTYIWEVKKYDLSYDSKGGSTVPSETVESNQKVTQPTNPTKEGYTFVGWYKEESYKNQWNFNADLMPTNNMTLYAKWEAIKHDVSYDSKGGSTVPSETVESNQKVTQPTNPTKEGYTFVGWYKEESYENQWNFNADLMPANNMTLYAKWEVNNAPIINTPTIKEKAVTSSIKTGDTTSIGILIVTLIGSTGILLMLKKKNKKNDEFQVN